MKLIMNAQDVKQVTVIGAGVMGEGIVQNFAQAGLRVNIVARHEQTLATCLTQIEANVRLFEEFGLLKEPPLRVLSRINPVLSQHMRQALEECDFVVETIPEILEIKRQLFSEVGSICSNTVLATNTSSYTVSSISEGMQHPERFVGIHYFNPAHIIPIVEVHQGKETTKEVINITEALMVRVGKKPILVRKEIPGFIVNRVIASLKREIDDLLDNGIVSPEDLDVAIKGSLGLRLACLGPMEAEDMIGLDNSAIASGRIFKMLSNRTEPSHKLIDKVNRGELGIKSGRGWYNYGQKTREQVYAEINKKLIQQLALHDAWESNTQ
jgi:3-hydroxyacyl-CoA dehydrogenase